MSRSNMASIRRRPWPTASALGAAVMTLSVACGPGPERVAVPACPAQGEVRVVVQASWSAPGGGVQVSVVPFVSGGAEDRVFSLRPEAEGSGPLSAAQLLRRGGHGYA